MKQSEYDAFGPWIYKIDEEHEIPRYFREYVDENDNALFRLKIPKKIERRDASPDSDLYEYLISVYEDRVVLMQIADGGIRLQKAVYDKVCAITMFKDLLMGRLTIYLGDSVFSFEFNAVTESLQLINEVVDTVRGGMGSKTFADPENFDINSLRPSDVYFVNELNTIKEQGTKFVNAACQDLRYLTRNTESGPVVGSLHMKTAKEWIVLKKLNQYAQEYLYIPRSSSPKFAFDGKAPYSGVKKMTIDVGNYSTEILYDEDNIPVIEHYQN